MFPASIHVIVIRAPSRDLDRIHEAAAAAETTGWQEMAGSVTRWNVYFLRESQAQQFAAALPDLVLSQHLIPVENWNAPAQAHWSARAVGRRLFLYPPRYAGPFPSDRLAIEMFPSAAFGAGDHPTTQLCLELMEASIQPGRAFLDIGCGDGTLCLAAHLLGARPVAGCDIDPITIAFAQTRCAPWPDIRLIAGSADAFRSQAFPVVALNTTLNVTAIVIADAVRTLTRDGTLILSGFPPQQEAHCEQLVSQHGLRITERVSRDGWSAALATR